MNAPKADQAQLWAQPQPRSCAYCGTLLSPNARSHAKVCSGSCRAQLSRARRAGMRLTRVEIGELHRWLRLMAEGLDDQWEIEIAGARLTVVVLPSRLRIGWRGNAVDYMAAGQARGWRLPPDVERHLHREVTAQLTAWMTNGGKIEP